MNRRVFLLLTLLAAVAACSSNSARPETTDAQGRLVCTLPSANIAFSTDVDSCGAALRDGRRLSREISNPHATDIGADIIFTSTCAIIQGDVVSTYSYASDLELAKRLNDEGVCPGDLSMLVPKR